jgi:hypothetical protein
VGLKWNRIHKLLAYADVSLLGDNIATINKNVSLNGHPTLVMNVWSLPPTLQLLPWHSSQIGTGINLPL